MIARLRQKINSYAPTSVASICLATIGVIFFVRAAYRERAYVEVVFVQEDLVQGALLHKQRLLTRRVPPPLVPRAAVAADDLEAVLERPTAYELVAGQMLLWTAVGDSYATFSQLIPKDDRLIALPVTSTQSLGGFVERHDHIDLFVTLPSKEGATFPLLQDIEVMEVDGPVEEPAHLLLRLSTKQTKKLLAATQVGQIHVALRNPDDRGSTTRRPMQESHLWDQVNRPQPQIILPKQLAE